MKTKKRIIVTVSVILSVILALFCIRILLINAFALEGEILRIAEDTIFMRVDNRSSISTSGNVYIYYSNPSEFEVGDYIKVVRTLTSVQLTSDPPYLCDIISITKIS